MPGVEACLQAGKWVPEAEHEAGEGPQRSRINRCSLVSEKHKNKDMKLMNTCCLSSLSLGKICFSMQWHMVIVDLFIYFCINLFSVMNHNIFAYFRHKSI